MFPKHGVRQVDRNLYAKKTQLDTIQACDRQHRQTDTQTNDDIIYCTIIALHGNKISAHNKITVFHYH